MNGKRSWRSKTLWANILSLAAIVIQTKTGYIVAPEIQASVLSLLNVGLRLITKEKIDW